MRTDQLIHGESILSYSDNGLLTLTTHRVRYLNHEWGRANFISIMLEKVSSVQITYLSYPVWLGIGGFLILIGLMWDYRDTQSQVILIVAGIAAIVAYFTARTSVCVIAADGGAKIQFRTDGMSTETLIEMMDKIERAKNDRVAQVRFCGG